MKAAESLAFGVKCLGLVKLRMLAFLNEVILSVRRLGFARHFIL
jgi:hypothetical protein